MNRKALIVVSLFIFSLLADKVAMAESLSFTGKVETKKKSLIRWKKDPFRPLIGAYKDSHLKLEAILYNKKKPSAIIDGEIVYIGGAIKGEKVIDIQKGHVILHGKSGSVRLELATMPGGRR